jgi:hypothetical protein
MRLGRIQDAAGTWYDVWICPGYAPPARYSADHFFIAGRNFREYFEANKYQMLRNGSTACLEWALKECGLGFTVQGIPRAWGRHFSVARERTQRRVFGWWLAYPWALMESTVETAFRGALGAVGTAGGVASGLAVVPAYHALDSAVAGTWNLGVNSLALPAAGIAWNTAVAPPLALIGQQPAPERVDGFWVTIVDSGHVPGHGPPTPEETTLLAQWGLRLLQETESTRQERAELERTAQAREKEYRKAIDALRKETRQQQDRIREAELACIRDVAASDAEIAALRRRHTGLRFTPGSREAVFNHLRNQGLSEAAAHRALDLLKAYRDSWNDRPKTDPVRRGAEVLGESAADVLEETLR